MLLHNLVMERKLPPNDSTTSFTDAIFDALLSLAALPIATALPPQAVQRRQSDEWSPFRRLLYQYGLASIQPRAPGQESQ
jgi:hypothetical protein